MTSLVVTMTGPDRPGLVNALSDTAAAHGANWADSVMANFANVFAGIVHLQVPPENCSALASALRALDAPDLRILVSVARNAGPAAAMRRLKLDLVGNDRPGIIHAISSQLARRGVGIDRMQSHITSGAWSGQQMFNLTAYLTVPAGLDADSLRAGLEGLANELMVDLSFEADTAAQS
jgi:glycine cleavage system regulatory protein